MTKLFGSSGIRGIYGEKITPELMLSVGKALGNYLKEGKVLLSRDTRKTSKLLENSFAAGVECTGVEVFRAGIAPTPALAFSARRLEMQSGAIITASHNPPEYNGVKLWNSDSSAYTPEMERRIEEIIAEESESGGEMAKWENITQSKTIDIISDYSKTILDTVKLEQKHKIALDCGNGAACAVSPGLLNKAGEVSELFCGADADFPGRKSEPCEENLSELKKKVVETGYEAGFAHDGDADRLGVIDENGNFVNKDKLLALIALNELEKKKGHIVVPVDTSLLVEEAVKNAGGTISMTPIGDVHVAVEMKKTNAIFGGEPSGCFIFPETHWCPDGILASLKVLEMIEKNGRLSEQAAELPDYFTIRKKIRCDDQEKACESMYEKVRALDMATRVLEIDGVRADLQEAWVLVRPSGTEPIVRLTVEARTKELADELLDKIHPDS